MLWAIDVGNTHTVIGLFEQDWRAVWRLASRSSDTEDALAAQLAQLCQLHGLDFQADCVVIGSVVPSLNQVWSALSEKWLRQPALFLENGAQVDLEVTYEPPAAVGADRIANALAAIEKFGSPVVVVDFGTATTFDTVDAAGRYVGGAIMPGVLISVEALAQRAARLPQVALEEPTAAIGRDTVGALRSGVMHGYAGAVDAIIDRIVVELGGSATVVATGGLAAKFERLCRRVQQIEPMLTLQGLLAASKRLRP